MKSRIMAFKHALDGGARLVATQPHARFHAVAALLVIAAAFYYRVSKADWALLVVCITIVWTAEAVNTAIEHLADEISLEWRERIRNAKDISAFAVLCASLGALTVGFLVFYPHVFGR